MKLKNVGKVYPSPSSSSSSSSSPCDDYLSILKLLPAAILALASVLSLEDREVLAYMITRSLKTTTTTTTTANNSSLISPSSKKKSPKKPPSNNAAAAAKMTQKGCGLAHRPLVFDCDCFDCYTSFWFRWDSSPNRELIHQVIEAFEDHLTNGEAKKPSKKNSRLKRKDGSCKMATRVADFPVVELPGQPDHEAPVFNCSTEEVPVFADVTPTDDKEAKEDVVEVTEVFPMDDADEEELITETAPVTAATTSNHKGLARKVLPDVLGLFNSRLWGLWNPTV